MIPKAEYKYIREGQSSSNAYVETSQSQTSGVNVIAPPENSNDHPERIFKEKAPFYFLQRYQAILMNTREHQPREKISYDTLVLGDNSSQFSEELLDAMCKGDKEKMKKLLPKLAHIDPAACSLENVPRGIKKLLKQVHVIRHGPLDSHILHYAVCENLVPLVAFLLENKANPMLKITNAGGYERCLLEEALKNDSSSDCIRLIIQYAKNKANFVNQRLTRYPLEYAFEKDRADVIIELLVNGADLDKAFEKRGIKEGEAFLNAAAYGHLEVVKLFHRAGFPLDFQDGQGRTGLHYAASNRKEHVVSFLLEKGANKTLVTVDGKDYVCDANEILAQRHQEAVSRLKALIDQKEDPDSHTPLETSVSDLLNFNEIIDDQGNTFLHYIMKVEMNVEALIIKDLLLKSGADPTIKNLRNETYIGLFEQFLKGLKPPVNEQQFYDLTQSFLKLNSLKQQWGANL